MLRGGCSAPGLENAKGPADSTCGGPLVLGMFWGAMPSTSLQ